MSSSASTARSTDAGRKGSGKEPELKRRKLLDAGGPVEDDETARQKMRDAWVYEKYQRGVDGTHDEYVGFDPDNVSDVKSIRTDRPGSAVKPMGYFARKGDLPMMRWLYVNGADTRDEEIVRWFPMYFAAGLGHLDVCKWLYDYGAAGDIKRRTDQGFTPLSFIFDESRKRDVSRWLILKGSLCKDGDTGDLDLGLMRHSLNQFDASARERPELLKWAREYNQPRVAFHMFLMGTLPKPESQCVPAIAGKRGILELIGDYVGIMRGREAQIIRQLTELLPGVIEELEDRDTDSDESSDDGDYSRLARLR